MGWLKCFNVVWSSVNLVISQSTSCIIIAFSDLFIWKVLIHCMNLKNWFQTLPVGVGVKIANGISFFFFIMFHLFLMISWNKQEKQLEKIKSCSVNTEVTALKEENANLAKTVEGLENDNKNLSTEVRKSSLEISRLKDSVQGLQRQVADNRSTIADLNVETERLRRIEHVSCCCWSLIFTFKLPSESTWWSVM